MLWFRQLQRDCQPLSLVQSFSKRRIDVCLKSSYDRFAGLLMLAGVELNGPHDWTFKCITKHSCPSAGQRIAGPRRILYGRLVDCRQLDEFFCRIRAELDSRVVSWRERVVVLKAILFNLQRCPCVSNRSAALWHRQRSVSTNA